MNELDLIYKNVEKLTEIYSKTYDSAIKQGMPEKRASFIAHIILSSTISRLADEGDAREPWEK